MSEGTLARLRRALNPPSIGGVLVAFILLGAVYAVTTPLFETPDELWHYPMVKTLADGNGLPVLDPANPGPWQQEAGQPPLYYALMALATHWIDTRDMEEVRWLNPHVDNGVVTEDGNNNLVIHTWREAWPWHGTALAIRLIRLLSVGLGAGTVYAAYRLALEIVPERRGLAVAVAALIAFTPMFVFISASVNNDSLVTFCSTLTLWALMRWQRQPPSRIGWGSVGLGILLGAGALSKQSALGLLPLTGLVLLAAHSQPLIVEPSPSLGEAAQRAPGRWRAVIGHATVVFGLALAVSGWWYWRNVQLYGDWLGWNRFIAIMGPRAQPASLEQLWGERDGFIRSLWGLFGHLSVPMPDWTYQVLNAGAGLAVVGLGFGLARAIAGRRITLHSILVWAPLMIWLSLIVVGLVRWTSLTLASQGRLIFPAIAVLSLLMVQGLAAVWPRLPAVLIVFLAGLSAFVPVFVIGPHYAPPPELTPEATAMIPHRVEANFGGEMQLLGYALETEAVQPGNSVRLTLYWQSLIAMDRNWSVFVHVVDDQGIIVGQRDRYPGRGALATTLLRPGQTFADTYVVPLPAGTYAPTEARISVGLYDAATGERLPLPTGDEALAFGQVTIQDRNGPAPNALRQNLGNVVELTGYDLERRSLQAGETLRLELYWQALRPISENYAVYVRVRDAQGVEWVKQDAWPQQGARPTVAWPVGVLITDTHDLNLPPDIPPGTYDVLAGMYASDTLQSLTLVSPDGRLLGDEMMALSRIRVIGP